MAKLKLREVHGEVYRGNILIGRIQKCPNPVKGPANKSWFYDLAEGFADGNTAEGKRAAMEALSALYDRYQAKKAQEGRSNG